MVTKETRRRALQRQIERLRRRQVELRAMSNRLAWLRLGVFVAALALSVAALALGLLNTFLRPLLMLLTLPVNILTLGLFTLFVNGFIFYLTAWLVGGFVVAGFWSAFFGALVFSVISCLLGILIDPEGR